ncbi:hypothetical protein Tco_0031029 [Tanacetum coccineum]
MPPKRTSTSEAPAMTQAAIRKLVADSVTAALEAKAATMANADNTNRNTREREAHVARKLFSRSNCTEYCKVKFGIGTLTEEALSWWNTFAQPIGIEEAYKITWGNDLKAYVRRFQELATLTHFGIIMNMKLLKRQSRHTRIIKKEEEAPLDGEFVKVKKETTEVDDDVSHLTRTLPVEDDKSSVTQPSREVLEAFKEQASLTKEKGETREILEKT